jgi:uncharacterized protein YdiU (UPF0061 family)
MRSSNPKYSLRKPTAQAAIDGSLQARDYTENDRVFKLRQGSFSGRTGMERPAGAPRNLTRDIRSGCVS